MTMKPALAPCLCLLASATAWATEPSLTVTLDRAQGHVRLHWESSTHATLEVSDDMERWEPLITLPSGVGEHILKFAEGRSRFFRAREVDPDSRQKPKEATSFTLASQKAVLDSLDFDDTTDFANAAVGVVSRPDPLVILNDQSQTIWDRAEYDFLDDTPTAPGTVNPSLWRQAQLNNQYGLFEVKASAIYQVRGYDLANITAVRGDTGWIIIDCLSLAETAAAGMKLIEQQFPGVPVSAVIYTHSHVDHFGGVGGVVTQEQVDGGIPVYGPPGFLEHAVSENVLVGGALARRSQFMYGTNLEIGRRGIVDAGLGKGLSKNGTTTLIAPTVTVVPPATLTIDGLTIDFLSADGTEAPSEYVFYLRNHKAICMSEVASKTLHNLYSLRGAQVRDAYLWAQVLNQVLEGWAREAEIMFASHHWPTLGTEAIQADLRAQRDVYKYIHDQTLRWMNRGLTMIEVAERVTLPDGLARRFGTRGYYGSVNHNVKAVYQRYMGWYDSNPSNLHPLPPVDAGAKYVEYMGGAENVVSNARRDFLAGNYRWVAQVLNHVVFADPTHQEARNLLADALEQLGYQAESGPWRNEYLSGAYELRGNEPAQVVSSFGSVIAAMSNSQLLDFLALRLDAEKAAGESLLYNINFTGPDDRYAVSIENSVLFHTRGTSFQSPNLTLTLARDVLNRLLLGELDPAQAVADGLVTLTGPGPVESLRAFAKLIEYQDSEVGLSNFNIIVP